MPSYAASRTQESIQEELPKKFGQLIQLSDGRAKGDSEMEIAAVTRGRFNADVWAAPLF